MSAHDHGDDVERGDKTPGGAIHVYAVPSRWQSIGCVTARLVTKRAAERVQPSTALTTTASTKEMRDG